jgi:hypothetical protein
MKKAIAMKCNQEQWDAIKVKLVGIENHICGDFINCPILTFTNDILINVQEVHSLLKSKELQKTWNEKIFLEACGIETEKIFNGSELQYWNYFDKKWENCNGDKKYRLKPDYSKEIEELEKQIEILKNK